MPPMTRQRVGASILLLIAFLTLVASRAFPFLDDVSDVGKTAVVLVGAACGLSGVYLWLRKTPTAKR